MFSHWGKTRAPDFPFSYHRQNIMYSARVIGSLSYFLCLNTTTLSEKLLKMKIRRLYLLNSIYIAVVSAEREREHIWVSIRRLWWLGKYAVGRQDDVGGLKEKSYTYIHSIYRDIARECVQCVCVCIDEETPCWFVVVVGFALTQSDSSRRTHRKKTSSHHHSCGPREIYSYGQLRSLAVCPSWTKPHRHNCPPPIVSS